MPGTRSPDNGAPSGVSGLARYRVLIYSHDSFGLGHIRRCRAIARALVSYHKRLNVLILSGSPIIGRFSFPSRVDFVRVPGVIKLRNGEYTSLNLDVHLDQTIALRASIIEHTAAVFRPHLFLVDKEPLGLLNEVQRTLAMLKRRGGCRLVLGLRDIMDDPPSIAEEWRRKRVIPALRRYYHQIWVYGVPAVYDPITAYRLPREVATKTVFTGYLPRDTKPDLPLPAEVDALIHRGPFLLVTAGGGGDGGELIEATLGAYERFGARLPWPALVVYGPFLSAREREAFDRRAARLPRVTVLDFHEHLENLIERAAGVVCLGGYNTFCEVLSLAKRCLIVPRVRPRTEQLLRAEAADRLGLARMLHPNRLSPGTLAEALLRMPEQPPPATAQLPGLLDGLRFINQAVAQWRLEVPVRLGGAAGARASREPRRRGAAARAGATA